MRSSPANTSICCTCRRFDAARPVFDAELHTLGVLPVAMNACVWRGVPLATSASGLRRSASGYAPPGGADLLELADPRPVQTALRRWGGVLPQYQVGHPTRVAAIRSAVAEVPGLAIAGAAFEGVGVPACIRDAHRAVDALL